MPIILPIEQRRGGARLVVGSIYLLLMIGALTMVYPFLITATSSLSNKMDYGRYSAYPRSFFSREDRFVRSLVAYFKDRPSDLLFRARPAHWSTWGNVGMDREGIDRFAAGYLGVESNPEQLARWRRRAADYGAFMLGYDIEDTFCNYDFRDLARHLEKEYTRRYLADHPEDAGRSRPWLRERALALLQEDWGVPYPDFFSVDLRYEISFPMHHVTWTYPDTGQTRAFLRFKDAYRRMVFRPGARKQWRQYLRREGMQSNSLTWPIYPDDPLWPEFCRLVGSKCPASPTRPFLMKEQWLKNFNRPDVKTTLGLDPNATFTVADYNRLFGENLDDLRDVHFPLAQDATPRLRTVWERFVQKYYPRRLIELPDTTALAARFRAEVRSSLRTVENYNTLMGTAFERIDDIAMPCRTPGAGDKLWMKFVDRLPVASLRLHSAEAAWQAYLLAKYGSLEGVNTAHGTALTRIEQAEIPFAEACTVTFLENEKRHYRHDLAANYIQVFDFLFLRGRAFLNTIILVVLTLIATLTVNPMAAYALSRFRLRASEQIVLFLLATMAFPHAVRAIPGFLLMRDLHLLNTYAALVLPGLANGMSIFILKGFFDGIPRELYEAGSIDGASEWKMFVTVTLPMTKPILAVNCLTAFIAVYGGWAWALLVCQKQSYWTLSVWLYQMSSTWGSYPWVTMAGFVIASIPTAVVFIACQKIIMRGIVVPSMK